MNRTQDADGSIPFSRWLQGCLAGMHSCAWTSRSTDRVWWQAASAGSLGIMVVDRFRGPPDKSGVPKIDFEIDFGDPSCWCDSCCDRCPVLDRCKIGQTMARRQRNRQLSGRDPSDWQVIVEDVERDLMQSPLMLAEACEIAGVDVSEIEAEQPKPVALEEAHRLGIELAVAAKAFADAALAGGATEWDKGLTVLVRGSALLAAKTTRLASDGAHETRSGSPDWPPPSAAILLLIEHTAERLDGAAAHLARFVAPAIRTRLEIARAEHERLWRSWLGHVSAEARSTMVALVEVGRAPSPFCRIRRP